MRWGDTGPRYINHTICPVPLKDPDPTNCSCWGCRHDLGTRCGAGHPYPHHYTSGEMFCWDFEDTLIEALIQDRGKWIGWAILAVAGLTITAYVVVAAVRWGWPA